MVDSKRITNNENTIKYCTTTAATTTNKSNKRKCNIGNYPIADQSKSARPLAFDDTYLSMSTERKGIGTSASFAAWLTRDTSLRPKANENPPGLWSR